MTLLVWHLRRGVPWAPLLGCCAAAALVFALLDRWPDSALMLLPTLVACCAAAAAFGFDETALAVVEVTPRGGQWRRGARLAVAGIPLLLWTAAVVLQPGDLPLHRPSWWLVGAAAIALTAGIAALASRQAVASPGGSLAAGVVLVVISPVILAAFLGWDSLYPVDGFSGGVRTFWLGIGVAGLLACLAALRPGVRR